MRDALKNPRPDSAMEAAGLGIFMVSPSVFTILLYHPGSPAIQALPEEFPRRILMGMAMGLTAIGIIYSPWGKQSGAHLNPAVTLTFFRLGKVAPWDAVFYIIAQFVGGVAGVALVAALAGHLLAHPSVNYVATLPGTGQRGNVVDGRMGEQVPRKRRNERDASYAADKLRDYVKHGIPRCDFAEPEKCQRHRGIQVSARLFAPWRVDNADGSQAHCHSHQDAPWEFFRQSLNGR